MNWDIGKHMVERHGFTGRFADDLPDTFLNREAVHDEDHDNRAADHDHDLKDPRIIKET